MTYWARQLAHNCLLQTLHSLPHLSPSPTHCGRPAQSEWASPVSNKEKKWADLLVLWAKKKKKRHTSAQKGRRPKRDVGPPGKRPVCQMASPALTVCLSQPVFPRAPPSCAKCCCSLFNKHFQTWTHHPPVLHSLHWLPVRFRIDFKLFVFVFKAINGLAPPYMSEILILREHNGALRSSGQLFLEVPRSRYKLWGIRAFAPPDIRIITDLVLLKSKLKTFLFRLAFNT